MCLICQIGRNVLLEAVLDTLSQLHIPKIQKLQESQNHDLGVKDRNLSSLVELKRLIDGEPLVLGEFVLVQI